ncbi:hypothetical protein SISNIDRAFT_468483 [Sistotremastrum niveocremeum HHB9708]|uniref:Uncharacterized protein n=1 Tax=Sistotremastrum niveocremeum HHB9708 TaxID=1314777 RepID=A0A164RAZ1_9AGAM|nr:hypothetical protein SISNIDRAFT_468483 [Sistotremastrum niveocremeum HHB9708]
MSLALYLTAVLKGKLSTNPTFFLDFTKYLEHAVKSLLSSKRRIPRREFFRIPIISIPENPHPDIEVVVFTTIVVGILEPKIFQINLLVNHNIVGPGHSSEKETGDVHGYSQHTDAGRCWTYGVGVKQKGPPKGIRRGQNKIEDGTRQGDDRHRLLLPGDGEEETMASESPKMIISMTIYQPFETSVQKNTTHRQPDRALNDLSTAVGAQMKHKASAGTLKT